MHTHGRLEDVVGSPFPVAGDTVGLFTCMKTTSQRWMFARPLFWRCFSALKMVGDLTWARWPAAGSFVDGACAATASSPVPTRNEGDI